MTDQPKRQRVTCLRSILLACILTPLVEGWSSPKITLALRHNILNNGADRPVVARTSTRLKALYYSSDDDDMENIPKLSSPSKWEGAGLPRPDLSPEEIPSLLMKALELNDFPEVDAGLQAMWDFSGDITRQLFHQNGRDFIECAHKDADVRPASFYGMALSGQSWEMQTELNRVGGENGYLATQIVKTISADGRLRRWQFMLKKNRRPPNLDCWFIESIGASDRTGNFDVD